MLCPATATLFKGATGAKVQECFAVIHAVTARVHADTLLQKEINVGGAMEVESSLV